MAAKESKHHASESSSIAGPIVNEIVGINKTGAAIFSFWIFLFASGVSMIGLTLSTLNLTQKEDRLWQQSELFRNHAQKLSEKTNKVISSVNRYATTFETGYLQTYWQSSEQDGELHNQLQRLEKFSHLPGVGQAISDYILVYRDLFDVQVHALSLILNGFEIPAEVMPTLMRDHRLAASEMRWSSDEKIRQAQSLLYRSETVKMIDRLWLDLEQIREAGQQYFSDQRIVLSEKISERLMFMLVIMVAMAVMIISIVWMRLMDEHRRGERRRRNKK